MAMGCWASKRLRKSSRAMNWATVKRLVYRHANGAPLLMLLQRQDATLYVAV